MCSGLTVRQYKEKHNNPKMTSEEFDLTTRGENNPNYKDGVCVIGAKMNCVGCGKPIKSRRLAKYCSSCTKKGESNPFFGRNHTDDTRAKMVESHTRRDPSTYKGVFNGDFAGASERAKTAWALLSPDEKTIRIDKLVAAGQKSNKLNKNTKIERRVKHILNMLDIECQTTVKIKNTRYYVDILIFDKVVIECYGTYWHCCPTIYSPDYYNESIYKTAQEKWDWDLQRQKKIENQGFEFFVVWESDTDIFKTVIKILNECRKRGIYGSSN